MWTLQERQLPQDDETWPRTTFEWEFVQEEDVYKVRPVRISVVREPRNQNGRKLIGFQWWIHNNWVICSVSFYTVKTRIDFTMRAITDLQVHSRRPLRFVKEYWFTSNSVLKNNGIWNLERLNGETAPLTSTNIHTPFLNLFFFSGEFAEFFVITRIQPKFQMPSYRYTLTKDSLMIDGFYILHTYKDQFFGQSRDQKTGASLIIWPLTCWQPKRTPGSSLFRPSPFSLDPST